MLTLVPASQKLPAAAGKITVEDFQGTATVLAFRDTWQRYKEVMEQDAVVLVTGKVSGSATAVLNMDWTPTTFQNEPLFYYAMIASGIILLLGWLGLVSEKELRTRRKYALCSRWMV